VEEAKQSESSDLGSTDTNVKEGYRSPDQGHNSDQVDQPRTPSADLMNLD